MCLLIYGSKTSFPIGGEVVFFRMREDEGLAFSRPSDVMTISVLRFRGHG